MRVVRGLETVPPATAPRVVGLGTFDGVHRGHQAVLGAVWDEARRRGGEAVALTFDPHPRQVIAPGVGRFLLTTLEERLRLFEAQGLDTVVVVRFDAALREQPPEAWLALLAARLRAVHFVVSSTHAFGRDRRGTAALLERWAREHGFGVTVVPPVVADGQTISSTAIRERLAAGDVRTAGAWLGRWYAASGAVVKGDGRGRALGVPTANLAVPAEKVLPGHGIYAAYATTGGRTYRSAVSIGVRPTFDGGTFAVEAHLLDVTLDLYGQMLELAFVDRLRDEVRFESAAALVAQMADDLGRVRRLLEDHVPAPAERE